MRHLLIPFLSALLITPFTSAQPLADRVPGDAVVYIGWRGADQLGEAYEQSHLKAVLDASDVGEIFTEFIPGAIRRATGDDPEAGRMMQVARDLARVVWRYPSAFYFGGIDFADPDQPMPRLALLCEAGDEAANLLERIQALLREAENVPIEAFHIDGIVVAAVGVGRENLVQAATNGSVAAEDGFSRAADAVQDDPVAIIYADARRVVELIDQAVARSGNPQVQENWPKVREALGLDGIHQIIWTGRFENREWASAAFIAAPAPRRGLAALLEPQPVDEQTLRLIPRNPLIGGAVSFDLARLVDQVREALGAIDPEAQQQFDQGLEVARMFTGVDIQQDLLEPLGSQWAYYVDTAVGGLSQWGLGIAVVNRLDDPARARQGLQRLQEVITAMLAEEMQDAEVQIHIRQRQVGELTINYLAVPLVNPSWAVDGDRLYLALYPQVIVSAIDASERGEESILNNQDFATLRQRLGGESPHSVQYMDLRQAVPAAYPVWLLITSYARMGDMFGVESPALLLPPLSRILPHVTPAGAVAWADDDGWHRRSASPFPGSRALGGDPSLSVATPALMVSILLPSLNRARETANRVACASNMRWIAMGMLMHADAHEGRFPDDLGTLLPTQDLTLEHFVCPSTRTAVPDMLRQQPIDQQADWINENSDYIYVGGGMDHRAHADTVVLYERFDNHGRDGINMLFADGHVEFLLLDDAQRLIEQQDHAARALPQADQPLGYD